MESSGASRARTTRSPWVAIVAAEILVVTGLVLVFLGFAGSFQFCTGSLGCDEQSSADGGVLLVLLLGVVAIVAAPAVISYLSGWPSPGRVATRSVLAFLAAFALTAMVFHDVLAGLVVALGVGGSLAMRPTSPHAVRGRVVAVVVLIVLGAAAHGSTSGSLLLALAALPAIGVADLIARSES
jgi:hypothetical protein